MDNEQERCKKHVEICIRNALYGMNPNIKENEKMIKKYFHKKEKYKNKQM